VLFCQLLQHRRPWTTLLLDAKLKKEKWEVEDHADTGDGGGDNVTSAAVSKLKVKKILQALQEKPGLVRKTE
jgi:hypothetical protein